MKWVGVVGTREVDDEIREVIHVEVTKCIANDCGVVSGGGTGADHEAAKIAFAKGAKLKIFLPTPLGVYETGLIERAKRGRQQLHDVYETIDLLRTIQQESPEVICENHDFVTVDAASFHARNSQIVRQADELLAFRINKSSGTTYTCEAAKELGKPVRIFDFVHDTIKY